MFRLLKSTFFTLFALFLFGLSAGSAHAQLDDIALRIDPLYPRPNSNIAATVESTSADVDTAAISWTVDGKAFKKGTGLKSIQIPVGKAGTATRISVSVSSSEGYYTASATVRPADVSLVWKNDGYIPPFYKGKALQTYGSNFSVTAIPEFFTSAGARINPKSLVYTWKKNGTIDPNQSGYGKDVYKSTQSSYVRGEDEISVDVTTAADDISSGRTISIAPGIPEILFYENSPLYGIMYEKNLGDMYYMKQEELVLHPVFYNFSIPNSEKINLTIQWYINGLLANGFSNKKELVVRGADGTGGESIINMKIQHPTKTMQAGDSNIRIIQ